jgi:hypothetical protein
MEYFTASMRRWKIFEPKPDGIDPIDGNRAARSPFYNFGKVLSPRFLFVVESYVLGMGSDLQEDAGKRKRLLQLHVQY